MSSEDSSSETSSASDAKDLLFRDVKFRLCDDLADGEGIRKILVDGGGKLVNYMSDLCTHLIADSDQHPEVTEALEIYEKPVVTSDWVHKSKSAGLLLPVRGFSPAKSQLFSGVVACPSHLSPDDLNSIWAMITFFGGSFTLTLTPECTHLISTKPEGKKYDKAMSLTGSGQKEIAIVTPDWIVDSVRNKCICDEELYHPRLLILPHPQQQHHRQTISLQSIEPDLIIKSNVTSTACAAAAAGICNSSNQSIVTAITTTQNVNVRNMPANSFITTISPSGVTNNPAMHQQQQLMQQHQHQQNAARHHHHQQQQQFRLLVPGQQNQPVRLMQLQRQMRPQQMQQMQQQPQYQMDPNAAAPRQVYLAPHQQPQVRPHQQQGQQLQQQPLPQQQQPGMQFIQIRGQQASYVTAEYQQQQMQQPVTQVAQKPANQVILQQRVQPPVHTLSANQSITQQQQSQMLIQQQQGQQRFPNNGQPQQQVQHRGMIASGQMIRSSVQMQQVVGLGAQQIRHPQQMPQQMQQQQQGYPLQQNIASGITGMQVQRVCYADPRSPARSHSSYYSY